MSVLSNYNFKNHIISPTRKKSCIDLIASNIPDCKAKTYYLALSDHETCQLLSCNLREKGSVNVKPQVWNEVIRDYSDYNLNKFKECISALSFSEVTEEMDTDTAFDKFHELVLLFYNLCFPLLKIQRKQKPIMNRWLTKGLRKCCSTKRKLHKIAYRSSKGREHLEKYKNYTKLLKRCLHKARQISSYRFIKNSKNVSRASWQVIKNACAMTGTISEINDCNGITCPKKIADYFNNFFIDSTDKNVQRKPESCNLDQNTNSLYLSLVNLEEVEKAIKYLNNTNATGYDGICTKVIKANASALKVPLAHILNLSFLQGVFPKRLKNVVVKPLYKKGSKSDPNNYRPIALIPVMSKIFERVMYNRLLSFITKYNILHNNQFGFRKNSSTSLACYHLIKEVTESLDKKTPMVAVFLDMSKAFDFVNHDILLQKLYRYGVRGPAWDWLACYLNKRQQCVEIAKVIGKDKIVFKSDYQYNGFGVPQGSILGPLLFLLYINDLPKTIDHKCILFADDTTLLIKYDKNAIFEDVIKKALTDIIAWLDSNNLQINLSKTKLIQFQTYKSKHLDIQIKHNDTTIEEVKSTKFLGLTIDCHCNWKDHVDNLRSKLDRFVYVLYRIRNVVSEAAALSAYHGYVSSQLKYGLILWGNSVDADVIFKAQKKCIRAITGAGFSDHCKPLFQKKNILTVPSMYIYEISIFVKKNPNCFLKMTTKSNRGVHRNKLLQPQTNLALCRKNVHCMAIKIYNIFTDKFKELPLKQFQKSLFEHLLERCYYSIDEFMTNCNL